MRSDCSASSGRTSKAGGVRRPARCNAASTSTISERRESSEPRTCCSRLSSGRNRASASPILVSTPRTSPAISINCALSLLRSWPIATISALSFTCSSAALFCCARVASSSCSRCLMASGEVATVCGVGACAAAVRLMPAKPADNNAMKSGPRRMVSRYERGFRVGCMNPNQCLLCVSALCTVIGVTRQNGRGPINLFQKHHANHLMRPCRGAERELELCHAPQFGRKSVRAADRENSVGDRLIAPAAKMPGKSGAVDAVAALVAAPPRRISQGLRPRLRSLPPKSGWPRRAPGFREFRESRGRESQVYARCHRIARGSVQPVPAPDPASAGRWR